MVKISVLLENTAVDERFKPRHGLSIAVGTGSSCFLLDLGPDATFLGNAAALDLDIGGIRTLCISHSHIDHGGGLDAFCQANEDAEIFLFDDPRSKYYARILGPIKMPVGLRCDDASSRRVTTISEARRIDGKTWFIRNTHEERQKPKYNKALYKVDSGKPRRDDFAHEGIVVVDDGELVIFNPCSHNGMYNTVASVKSAFAGKRIRSYVGGLHSFDPISKRREGDRELDMAAMFLKSEGIKLYAGHCTGEYCLAYLGKRLGEDFTRIRTGSVLLV